MTKTKAPAHECEGLLKAFASALALSFLLHQGVFTDNQSNLDPKLPR
jgi:hypothetical protein